MGSSAPNHGKSYEYYMCHKWWHPRNKWMQRRKFMDLQKIEYEKKRQKELLEEKRKETDALTVRRLQGDSKAPTGLEFMYEPPPGLAPKILSSMEKLDAEKEAEAFAEADRKGDPPVKFEWERKRTAPREDYVKNARIRDKPFAIDPIPVRCLRCRVFGHRHTDTNCPWYTADLTREPTNQEIEAAALKSLNDEINPPRQPSPDPEFATKPAFQLRTEGLLDGVRIAERLKPHRYEFDLPLVPELADISDEILDKLERAETGKGSLDEVDDDELKEPVWEERTKPVVLARQAKQAKRRLIRETLMRVRREVAEEHLEKTKPDRMAKNREDAVIIRLKAPTDVLQLSSDEEEIEDGGIISSDDEDDPNDSDSACIVSSSSQAVSSSSAVQSDDGDDEVEVVSTSVGRRGCRDSPICLD